MKRMKVITTFLLLFTLSIFISDADIKYNDWTNDYIKTFEDTNSSFSFYNIKVNGTALNINSIDNIKKICVDAVKCIDIKEEKIKWTEKEENNNINIYAEIEDKNNNIYFSAIKKNEQDYYIIIDISSNKVYKNIGDVYHNLNKVLNKNLKDIQITTCIVGEYSKILQSNKCDEIFANILYNMKANKIDTVMDSNYISVTAYSNLLKDNNLEYLENKINLNIGIRYSENEDKTLIYIATPIIKLEY